MSLRITGAEQTPGHDQPVTAAFCDLVDAALFIEDYATYVDNL